MFDSLITVMFMRSILSYFKMGSLFFTKIVHTIMSHIISACHKKKLVDGICPTCQGDMHTWTYKAKVCITGEDLSKEVVLFQNNLEKLFGTAEERSDNLLICFRARNF
jgi:6-pyruvoyl-tetrahydropterin synthase